MRGRGWAINVLGKSEEQIDEAEYGDEGRVRFSNNLKPQV